MVYRGPQKHPVLYEHSKYMNIILRKPSVVNLMDITKVKYFAVNKYINQYILTMDTIKSKIYKIAKTLHTENF